jgi:hypothetical protein
MPDVSLPRHAADPRAEDVPSPTVERICLRLRWPDGPTCPFCRARAIYVLDGSRRRRSRFKCAACRRQFSVTKSTILENSRLPLEVWLDASRLLTASAEAPTVAGLERHLGIGRTAARNILARIAYAAERPALGGLLPPARPAGGGPAFDHLTAEAFLAALLATPAPTDTPDRSGENI